VDPIGLHPPPPFPLKINFKQNLLRFMVVTVFLSTKIWRFSLPCRYKYIRGISWEILAKTNDVRYLDQINQVNTITHVPPNLLHCLHRPSETRPTQHNHKYLKCDYLNHRFIFTKQILLLIMVPEIPLHLWSFILIVLLLRAISLH
jgi:hypothetical protein